MDYKKAYQILFNAITDALTEFDKADDKSIEMIRAERVLKNIQQQTEAMYIEAKLRRRQIRNS